MGQSQHAHAVESLRRETERVGALAPGRERHVLEAILRHSPHGIIVADARGKLMLHNVAAEHIWGGSATAESMEEWESYRAFHADGRPYTFDDWSLARCLATGQSIGPEEVRIERFDGTRGVLLCSAAPIVTADGHVDGGIAVFADITRWKELEIDTEAAHRRASFLSEAGTILLSSALDLRETCERAADLVIKRVASGCVIEIDGELEVATHTDANKASAVRALCNGTRRWSDLSSDVGRMMALQALGLKTLLVVPMHARGTNIGAVAMWSDDARSYDSEDRAMMERFAQKAALAVESARSYRAERQARARIERAAERARRVQTIATDLASALSPDQVGHALVDHGVSAVGAITGGLWVVEPSGETARVLRTLGFPPEVEKHFEVIPMSATVPVIDAIRRSEPVIVESRAEYEARYPEMAEQMRGVTTSDGFALAVLPLIVGHAAIGALTFTWPEERKIEEDERAFLRLIAGHGAQGLVRAQLYEAERRARAEIALLYRLVDAASQAMTLDDVYELALDVVGRALGVDRASILLFDTDGVMRFRAWRGISDGYRTAVDGHSPWSIGTTDAQVIVVPDVTADASLSKYAPVFEREQIRALAFVPLVHRKQLLGKLMLYSSTERTLQPDEIRVAQSIATEVAHAIARKQGEAEIVRLFAEAQAARSAAEEASRMKDEFLGVVSHELRTPLSAILGWAGILKNNNDVTLAAREKGVAVIERNARAQLKIIEDILDVSRIISGKLIIERKPTRLSQLVAEAIDVVRPSANAKDISITFEPPDDPHTMLCDPERMRQIVWNLLSNAIKFTPCGGRVQLRLHREATSISLEVRDTGPGISPEFLPHVFERFRQGDSSTKRAQAGLGLGLAIVRHLVELHGGQVRADSLGVGQGATFTVTLPMRRETGEIRLRDADTGAQPIEPRAQAMETQLHARRILIVDDNADAREMLEHALQMHGADVRTAGDASAALRQIDEFHPDVLISDIGMPNEDGYSLIQRVRALPTSDRQLRAIAFTAYARTTDRARALEAGYDEHVAKPLHLAAFAQLVADVSKRRRAPGDVVGS